MQSAVEPAKRVPRAPDEPPRSTVAKVSHTLEVVLAEHLREFAFHERISESAVIEFALNSFFVSEKDAKLGLILRNNGAGKRRRI